MWKKLALISVSLWILTCTIFAYFFINGNTKQLDDGRISVKLTKDEKNRVLGEMRLLLSGVQMILAAALDNNLKVVEKTATSLGMKVATEEDPSLLAKLPIDLKKIGLGVHRRFDKLADKAHSGATKEEVIREVSEIMLTCVGCHEAYRLDISE